MVTLFGRLISLGEEGDQGKIALHTIRAVASEVMTNDLSGAEVKVALALTDDQATDFALLVNKIQSHPQPYKMHAKVFDWLLMAEIEMKPSVYADEAKFWARIDAEIANG
jgi:hypothetical protein